MYKVSHYVAIHRTHPPSVIHSFAGLLTAKLSEEASWSWLCDMQAYRLEVWT